MLNNVLVLGGSYFIGRKIVDVLVNNNYTVTVLNRGSKPVENAQQIKCDRDNAVDMKLALKDRFYDIVIDVSGTNKKQMEILVDSLDFQKTKKFIFISSSAVYDVDKLKAPFCENDNLERNSHWTDYGYNKIEAEQYLSQKFANTDAQLTFLRPPYMYGENNYAQRESFIFNRITNNLPVILPANNPKLQFLYTTDLANIIVELLKTDTGNISIYNLGNKQPVTAKEWVEECGRAMGKIPKIIMYDYEKDGYYIRDFFPFPNYDNVLDVQEINNKISICETPFVTGLQESYKWYLQNKNNIPFKEFVEENCSKIVLQIKK